MSSLTNLPWKTIIGLLADVLTFAGGGLLAIDAIWKEKEFRYTKALTSVVTKMSHLDLEDSRGERLSTAEDVDLKFIRESDRRGRIGFLVRQSDSCFSSSRAFSWRQRATKMVCRLCRKFG